MLTISNGGVVNSNATDRRRCRDGTSTLTVTGAGLGFERV